MSPLLIQYLFFLSICTMTHGMDTNSGQKNIVRSMLNNNNEKLQNWDFGLTAKPARINKPTRTKMQPLPQDLQLDPITIITNHAHKTGNGSLLCSLYNNVAPGMVYESCVLKPETEKFHKTINKSMKELAKTNITAQIYVAQKLVDQCVPLFNDAAFLLQTEKQEIKYALELFGFLHPLAEEKKLITPESLKGKINTIKREVCPSVSYILHACRCLQAVTHTEKETTLFHFKNQRCPNNSEIEAICQFLINYGDATLSPEESAKKFLRSITTYPQLLYKITQPSLNSHIIAKLRNVQLNANDPLFPLLNYVLAEFYFHDKDYHNAHTYYSKNSAGYLCHKKLSLKALIACIASTENFSLETISYLLSLRNICHKLIKIKQSNPKLSYNIGLFVRALFNNNYCLGSPYVCSKKWTLE